jgi:hypothetical protein
MTFRGSSEVLSRVGLILLAVAGGAAAQELLDAAQAKKVEAFLDAAQHGKSLQRLDCKALPYPAFLDFSFRFEAGYTIACPINLFGGHETVLRSFVRVTPESRPAFVLSEFYGIPGLTPELLARTDVKKSKATFEASGGFFLREGKYDVEILLLDKGHRIYTRQWHLQVRRERIEQSVHLAALPDAVCPLSIGWSSPEIAGPVHRRVTILVDAAPTNPYSRRLRAWDRALLLGSVSSVIHALPGSDVRLIAFNLDQQLELFRTDHFVTAEMPKLARAMEKLELGAISVDKLKRANGGVDLATSLADAENAADGAPDAVIFVGPWTRTDAHFEKRKQAGERKGPQFYDIVYFPPFMRGQEFPDVIQRLTEWENGSVHRVHSPAELGRALQKISVRLGAAAREDSGG